MVVVAEEAAAMAGAVASATALSVVVYTVALASPSLVEEEEACSFDSPWYTVEAAVAPGEGVCSWHWEGEEAESDPPFCLRWKRAATGRFD